MTPAERVAAGLEWAPDRLSVVTARVSRTPAGTSRGPVAGPATGPDHTLPVEGGRAVSTIVSNDDRVRRIITDPVGYFAEARARAKSQVRAEMAREAQGRTSPKTGDKRSRRRR